MLVDHLSERLRELMVERYQQHHMTEEVVVEINKHQIYPMREIFFSGNCKPCVLFARNVPLNGDSGT